MHGSTITIGLTLSADAASKELASPGTDKYCQALQGEGVALVLLFPGGDPADVTALDGLLLSGGPDVDPAHYGEARHEKLGTVDAARDALELPLTRAARERGVPMLGICRGAQVLGVALGGKLHQDIPACLPSALPHSADNDDGARHPVRLAADSRLRAILGLEMAEVNSFHHQANSQLGPGLRAVAGSDDGVIEAVEAEGEPFVIGVQWHPERMVACEAAQARLFAAFLAAARDYARDRPRVRK